jgi:hypothetical protein
MHNSSNATITKGIYGATVIESIYGLACAHAHTHIYSGVCVCVCRPESIKNYPPSSYRVKMNIKTVPLFDDTKDSSEKENELFDN